MLGYISITGAGLEGHSTGPKEGLMSMLLLLEGILFQILHGFPILVAQMTSTLLVEPKQMASAFLMVVLLVASASPIVVAYWAFISLIASEVSISFWQ